MAEYAGRLPLFHVDLYRLADAADALAGGLLDERQATGVTLVEWPDRMGDAAAGAPARRRRSTGRGDEPRDDHDPRRRPALARYLEATPCRRMPEQPQTRRRRVAARDRHRDEPRRRGRRRRRTARSSAATTWAAGHATASSSCRRSGACSARRDLRRSRIRGDDRRDRARARSPGCGSGSRPRRRSPTRSACRSSASRPARRCSPRRPTARRSRTARPPAAGRPERSDRRPAATGAGAAAGRDRAGARRRRVARRASTSTAGRPADAVARGERARDGLGGRAGAARRRPARRRRRRRPRAARPGLRHAAARRRGRERGGRMVARPPVKLTIEPMRLEDLEAVQRIELASFSAPWPPNAYRSELETNRLATYLVARIDGRDRRLRRDVADGRRGPHHDVRRPSGLAPPADRRAAAPRVPRPRPRPPRARGDARGPAVEHRRPAAVREVRLPAGRAPAALLQRQQRGRADHDDRADRRAALSRADRAAAGGARRVAAAGPRPDRSAPRPDATGPQPATGATGARSPRRERAADPRGRIVVRRDRDRA